MKIYIFIMVNRRRIYTYKVYHKNDNLFYELRKIYLYGDRRFGAQRKHTLWCESQVKAEEFNLTLLLWEFIIFFFLNPSGHIT